MRISLNLLKTCVSVDLEAHQIADILTDIGLEVEGIETLGRSAQQLSGVVTGLVTQVIPHPNADRLRLVRVDIGNAEPLRIVCGAPNVSVGQKVAVATVGTVLHPTQGEAFEIKTSKIRGEISEGMICAEDELGIGESHEGIMVLQENTPVGIALSEAIPLQNDVLLEIGLTPNRTDAMSHFGVARDLAAALNARNISTSHAFLPDVSYFKEGVGPAPISIEIKDTDACPRYAAICIEGVSVGPSPAWLQNILRCLDIGPINNIVDITNYVLHLCGQPLHAFDASAIEGQRVVVRKADYGEQFITLDRKSRTLDPDDLMICNARKPMCIAGVFGGQKSGVTDNTTSIFLESAYFAPGGIRRTARRHDLHTDAAYRYERGSDPDMCLYAARLAATMMCEIAGGRIAGPIQDIYPNKIEAARFAFDPAICKKLGGVEISTENILKILRLLGINAKTDTPVWQLEVPSFKRDVQTPADVVEEILRIYGFDQIELPAQLRIAIDLNGVQQTELHRRRAADFLVAQGFSEAMNLSFEEETDPSTKGLKLRNPLASESAVMRTSLRGGLLRNAAYNLNRQEKNIRLFEFGRIYETTNSRLQETEILGIALCGAFELSDWRKKEKPGDAFDMLGLLRGWVGALIPGNIHWEVSEAEGEIQVSVNRKPFALLRQSDKRELKKYDLRQPVWVAECRAEVLWDLTTHQKAAYSEIPRFPTVRRDLALIVEEGVTFATMQKIAFKAGGPFLKEVDIFDVFKGGALPEGTKSYALSFVFRNDAQTLSDPEIDQTMRTLYEALKTHCGAKLRVGEL
jgi:phenylalanyl-tRNA synthetase beta chain